MRTTIDGTDVEITHSKATYAWPASIDLTVGSNHKYFSYGHSALAKYNNKQEASDNMFAELNNSLLRKYGAAYE